MLVNVPLCSAFLKAVHLRPTQDEYQLHLGEYSGNAGNALLNPRMATPVGHKWLPAIKFSTYDHLNDSESRCIRHSKAGWWFSR